MTIEQMNRRRQELGYTYAEVAEMAELPLSTVQKVLGGITRHPRRETLAALQRVLGEEERAWVRRYLSEDRSTQASMVAESVFSYVSLPEKKQGQYTIEDVEALPEEQRVELIDGVIYDLAAPSVVHQVILMELAFSFRTQIEACGRDCLVLFAPTDVQIAKDLFTMVQPDLMVVCDREVLTRRRVVGAPDLLVEILSPSTKALDHEIKWKKYKETGVREYWIVDPDKRKIYVYTFEDLGVADIAVYTFRDRVPVGISEGHCSVDFAAIDDRLAALEL